MGPNERERDWIWLGVEGIGEFVPAISSLVPFLLVQRKK